ncbi:Rieske (2Fe-2S) protein [Alteribacillus iranensis]|uniref:Ferredoxin subunit of nitrite reductase or a ring-hydroxylating dioxygenase n=1 Tax=Alteribacillus iranensis TaxID=930128 RepID=A0A1I2BBX6_9BACI|nr:Rieske (2Fe-2S) protein [Alteribacillus iranensis]SFE52650.1 Ferredoxin subunit of nitrite reductase or a ring-hydroxylating dioxygenase [Alteribacillus iranensis]
MKYTICKKNELLPGEKKAVSVGKKSIVVVCTGDNEYHAIKNSCPHQGAELSEGRVGGTTVSQEVGVIQYDKINEVIRCPWHGFEFNVKTGCPLYPSDKTRIKTYDVQVEDENIVINL